MENKNKILHIAPCNGNAYCSITTLNNCETKEPLQLFQDEMHQFMKAEIIIIDLDYTMSGDYKGLELLKVIRLYHLRTHCIVYSVMPEKEYFYADANKSILLSEGVTFIQMPSFIDEKHLDFKALAKQQSPDDLRDYFWHDYQQCFSDNRHFNANWWGPLRIMEYLKRADGIEEESLALQGNSNILGLKSSYNGLVLRYVKTLKEQSIWDSRVENVMATNSLLKEENRQLEQDKAAIAEAIQRVATKITSKEDVITAALNPINNEISENQELIETKQQEFEEYQQALEAQHTHNASTQNIESLRTVLAKQTPKILYLDDMAGYGWNVVLQRLIYRKNESDCFEIQSYFSENTDDYSELAKTIIKRIEETDTQLLILDLRLKNEKGDVKAKDLSGVQLLEALRKKHVACPILVVTASRNPETIEQVYASGADACWRKEGIDENNAINPEERVAFTWSKIEQLLTIISTLCGEEFQYLYKTMVAKYYLPIQQQKDKYYWWEVIGQHNATGMQSITKSMFMEQLDAAIYSYQKVLIEKLKGRHEWNEFLTPCQSLFVIMSNIHPGRVIIGEDGKNKEIKGFRDLLNHDFDIDPKLRKDQLDPIIQAIFNANKVRNGIIHPDNRVVTFVDFTECVKNLVGNYLMKSYDQIKHLVPNHNQNTAGNSVTTVSTDRKAKHKTEEVPPINDQAVIKNIRVNEEDGSLWCQLSDLHIAAKRIEKMTPDNISVDWRQKVEFLPVAFNENQRVIIDMSCKDVSLWKGRIIMAWENGGIIQKVTDIECQDNNAWYKIDRHEDGIMVGDKIQFAFKGPLSSLTIDVIEIVKE